MQYEISQYLHILFNIFYVHNMIKSTRGYLGHLRKALPNIRYFFYNEIKLRHFKCDLKCSKVFK